MDETPPPLGPPKMDLAQMLLMQDKEQTELDKIIELMLDPRNIAHNTELTRNEITAFSVLATLAERHNLPVLREFLKQNLILRVSKSRKGRQELIRMLNREMGLQHEMQQQEMRRSWFGGRRAR